MNKKSNTSTMSERVVRGPCKDLRFPLQAVGNLFYDELRKLDPDKIAIIDAETGDEISYRQLLKLSIDLAGELIKFGLQKNDVIAIVSENKWKHFPTVLSAFYLGVQVCVLNPDYTSNELQGILSVCPPKLIFSSKKSLQNIIGLEEKQCSPQKIVCFDNTEHNLVLPFDNLLKNENKTFCSAQANPHEDVVLIFTSSGTTGLPKCVPHTYKTIISCISFWGDPAGMAFDKNDSVISYLPFFHGLGFYNAWSSIIFGTKQIIVSKFMPEKFLHLIEEHKITKLLAIPFIINFLATSLLTAKYDLSSVTDIVGGGGTITANLENAIKNKLQVKNVRQGYGMTELGFLTLVPKEINKSGSVGKPSPNVAIKIWDSQNGKYLGPKETGELRVKSNGLMRGYLGANRQENLNAFDDDGFFKTGDLGYYDEDEFFFIVGRVKDIIKYKGFQVSPAELEQLLIQHPAVEDAGVIGVPDERAGEVPLAFVVRKPDVAVTQAEIVNYVAENISAQKRLYGGVKFVEEIPRTSLGKIMTCKLKELLP